MSGIQDPTIKPAVSRRRVLRAVTIAGATVLSGCASNPFSEPAPTGQLFVENRTNFRKLIALSVTDDTQNGNPIINHEYRIPAWHALQFEGVLEAGHTYDIRAFQPNARGRGDERLVLSVESCEEGDQSGQMDVSILASSNGPDVLTYGCDEPYNEVQSLTYVDPSEYEIQPITGTIPTPTPS